MSNNLRLPTGGSVNWGSNLNAYLESLNSRVSGIESTISKTLLSGNRIMQNLGAYASGLVGNRTKISYDKNTDTLTVTDLNVYIGGDILTYYEIGNVTYTKSLATCSSNMAYYVFLQYDIENDNFEIACSLDFNSVNYTQILLGVYFNKNFTPFYMSNLKTIAQHFDEFNRAYVDFDTNNIGIQINLKKTEYPSIQFGNLNIIDTTSSWSEVTEETGPIFHMDGIGYDYDNGISGDTKWYADDTLLSQKVLNLKDPTIIYLQDSISSNNVVTSSIVDTTGTDKSFLPASDDIFRGHYYRILISVIDQIVIVQKSIETNFMNFSSYSIREQNLYNVKFNNNFLIQDEDEEYILALDALFCVEVARFAVNDLKSYLVSNSDSLLYQTGSVTYPSKAIQYNNICAQMEASDENRNGLYYPSTDETKAEFAIQSATEGALTFVKSNHSSWRCVQDYNSPCTETNFFDYWKLIDTVQGAASLQANFVFVPSIEKGAASKTKWNIWQTTQGRIDCNVVDFATDKNSNPVTLAFNTPNAGDLSIKFDLLQGLPLCEAFESDDTETYNVLFTEHYAEEPIFLAAKENISLVLNDNLSYEQPTSNEILIGNYCSGANINIHNADSAGGINITSNNLSLSVWSDNGSQSTNLITLTKTIDDATGNATTNILFENADIKIKDKKLTLSGDSYMEVTSDKRLKNNIKLYDVNALNIVNNTPIVTFNYNHSTISTLGMIAQELKSNLLNPELLISVAPTANIKDLHTIHETKLIYVLWKAVQELSSELDSIKKNLILDTSV